MTSTALATGTAMHTAIVKTKARITNVHVDAVSYDGRKVAAGFNYREGRYHIWFDPQTMEAEDTLHKNRIEPSTPRRCSDHKSLNPTSITNTKLLAAMWAEIAERGLVAKALADHAAKKAREQAERESEHREHLKEQMGPKLFDLAATLIANARIIPDPQMSGTTDIYAVPIDDIVALKALLASLK